MHIFELLKTVPKKLIKSLGEHAIFAKREWDSNLVSTAYVSKKPQVFVKLIIEEVFYFVKGILKKQSRILVGQKLFLDVHWIYKLPTTEKKKFH